MSHPVCYAAPIMWLITQHGFYSLVRDRENATRFLVRSRSSSDLKNLKALAGLEACIRETLEAEYPYRMIIDEREMPRVMNALANTVDYPCFTARLAQRIDQACRTLLYGEVMQTLREIGEPLFRGRPRAGLSNCAPVEPKQQEALTTPTLVPARESSYGQGKLFEPAPLSHPRLRSRQATANRLGTL